MPPPYFTYNFLNKIDALAQYENKKGYVSAVDHIFIAFEQLINVHRSTGHEQTATQAADLIMEILLYLNKCSVSKEQIEYYINTAYFKRINKDRKYGDELKEQQN